MRTHERAARPANLVLPGTNYLRARTLPYAPGFIDELSDGLPCADGTCDPTTGTPVMVEPDPWTTGLELVLEPACTGALSLGPAWRGPRTRNSSPPVRSGRRPSRCAPEHPLRA